MSDIVTDVQSLGLVFDLMGILVLGLPLALRGHSAIGEQAGTYWDFNPPLAKELYLAKLDALLGTSALAAGFAMQIVAVQWVERVSVATGWSFLVVLVAVCAVHACLRSDYAERHVNRLERKQLEANAG